MYLRLKICVGVGGNVTLKCLLIEVGIPNLSLINILYIYQKSLKRGYELKITV